MFRLYQNLNILSENVIDNIIDIVLENQKIGTPLLVLTAVVLVLGVIAANLWWSRTGQDILGAATQNEIDLAVLEAYSVYDKAVRQGVDMADGPCLSEELMDDWVLDIAHNPRQSVDNLPENQCESYRSGAANHFVELDPDGNHIRAQ